ncbi:unnamed protein product [Didymodactylos carnosus]|uniref:Uncharacterized protein n=1 Tax=Didymodactylos carnosus TaxID=1234261 RepID=A0A814RC15_9BILA|nr:unnamed protein product [Didymodactylos carnosus]CAF3895724.1 unnamed protein product [Didymodactylos carnosus]
MSNVGVAQMSDCVAGIISSIEDVADDADDKWAYHRFSLLNEYQDKSTLPPPFSSIYYFLRIIIWVRRKLLIYKQKRHKYVDYGTLSSSSDLKPGLDNSIVFNGVDQIQESGIVNKVSINFRIAPTGKHAKITLYIITPTKYPDKFIIESEHKISSAQIKSSSGKQSISIGEDIQVRPKQYLGISFDHYSGYPYSTERNQYCLNYKKYELHKDLLFINCPSRGLTFSFIVKPSTSERETTNKTKKKHPSMLSSFPPSSKEHRDILKENSIAQDYWQLVIRKIKKKEKSQMTNDIRQKILHDQDGEIVAEDDTLKKMKKTYRSNKKRTEV